MLSRWLVARVLSIACAAVLIAHTTRESLGPTAAAVVAILGAVASYATFAEILNTVARKRPGTIGRLALRFLQPLEWAMAPIAIPLATLGRLVDRHVSPEAEASDARMTENEVEWLVARGEEAGALEKEPATMIRNVLDFQNLTAKDVMIPRRRVASIDVTMPLPDVLEHVVKDGHSRYPVYRESLDNVVGLLYVKDLFEVVRAKKLTQAKLESLLRKPVLFIAESQAAVSVLREMRGRRLHLAIVSDEFGGTSGIVTLEDIIEEIVGEIQDEYDTDDIAPIQKVGEGRFVADAAIPIGDLETYIGEKLPEEGHFESLGGFIVHRAGRVPEVGATVALDGYQLIVREADETHVVKVEIVRAEPETAKAMEASVP